MASGGFPAAIWRRWHSHSAVATPLAGGLSGAVAWSVDHAGRRFVLKRFAASATREHAAWVHALMRHVRAEGVLEVPALEPAADGATLQADEAGTLWELMEWKSGHTAAPPTTQQVAAAALVVARVHRAAAAWPACPSRVDHSPGVIHRVARARDLLARPWATRISTTWRGPLREHFDRAIAIWAERGGQQALARVTAWESQPVAVQPVLRDVWSEHVLFRGEQVAGIIDWHAAGVDTPATDLARLAGSWPGDPATLRTFLDSYSAVRPLAEEEAALVPFLRDTGILFGFDNWFRWIVEENRPFADTNAVGKRIEALLAALPDAVQRLASGVPQGGEESRSPSIDRKKTAPLDFFHDNNS
jgi:Ser/Thr protein kinase RdoA (MazF antagonist)